METILVICAVIATGALVWIAHVLTHLVFNLNKIAIPFLTKLDSVSRNVDRIGSILRERT